MRKDEPRGTTLGRGAFSSVAFLRRLNRRRSARFIAASVRDNPTDSAFWTRGEDSLEGCFNSRLGVTWRRSGGLELMRAIVSQSIECTPARLSVFQQICKAVRLHHSFIN